MNSGTGTAKIFVGRQQEMVALETALTDAFSGQGRLAMLAGEPGIGKTRVAQELAYHADALVGPSARLEYSVNSKIIY